MKSSCFSRSSAFHAVLTVLSLALILAACRGETESPDESPTPESPPIEEAGAEESGSGAEAGECPTPDQSGSGDHRAGLVVTFGDGNTETVCVSFSEEQINGYDLLQRSGLTIVSEFFPNQNGYGICKISNAASNGCDYPDESCFCDASSFWAFWILENDSTWEFSQVGVSQATVDDGDVQGQKWNGDDDPPPVCAFEQICGE